MESGELREGRREGGKEFLPGAWARAEVWKGCRWEAIDSSSRTPALRGGTQTPGPLPQAHGRRETGGALTRCRVCALLSRLWGGREGGRDRGMGKGVGERGARVGGTGRYGGGGARKRGRRKEISRLSYGYDRQAKTRHSFLPLLPPLHIHPKHLTGERRL